MAIHNLWRWRLDYWISNCWPNPQKKHQRQHSYSILYVILSLELQKHPSLSKEWTWLLSLMGLFWTNKHHSLAKILMLETQLNTHLLTLSQVSLQLEHTLSSFNLWTLKKKIMAVLHSNSNYDNSLWIYICSKNF